MDDACYRPSESCDRRRLSGCECVPPFREGNKIVCWPLIVIFFKYIETIKRSACSDSTGRRHIPDAEGRVGSVDTGIFIHAVVPRHVEVVTLITRAGVETTELM